MITETATHPTVERIRAMMTRHNLNQPQMEKVLGVSHGTLGNWLTGTRSPDQIVARFIAVLETAELFHPTLFQPILAQARAGK